MSRNALKTKYEGAATQMKKRAVNTSINEWARPLGLRSLILLKSSLTTGRKATSSGMD